MFSAKKKLNFIVEKWFLSQLKYTYSENENVSIASIATVWDGKKTLKNIRININKLIFGSLNINFSRNKFDLRCKQIKGSIDIFMISETKLDDSFPQGHF